MTSFSKASSEWTELRMRAGDQEQGAREMRSSGRDQHVEVRPRPDQHGGTLGQAKLELGGSRVTDRDECENKGREVESWAGQKAVRTDDQAANRPDMDKQGGNIDDTPPSPQDQ
ncbi:hypothetical protein RRG08_014646 [Elysia crispata]|uniref:Uncharacterized protein n=1 Tax=Elysia crispata TaxID=231223 RepID=A0AAE0YHV3_9GAST|nr:hypothetical protein RRG08_014646 [Elysia crispata]